MQQATIYAAILVQAGITVFLGYCVQRADFQVFIATYAALFGVYALLLWTRHPFNSRQIFWLGIGLRALLLFNIPNFSEDYARFLWDGRLILNGIHPFDYPPVYFAQQGIWPPGITPELYARLNSPNYFSVYPPLCQAVFALAAIPKSELGGVVVLKIALLACEAGTLKLLLSGKLAPYLPDHQKLEWVGLAYALNPLIIMEIAGNAHFEGGMIFLTLAGLAAFAQNKARKAAGLWALATAVKLLPVLFVPLIWRKLGWKKGWNWVLWYGVFCLLLFSPLIPALPHMLKSVNLYFQKFQFNASLYYLLRFVGYKVYGWDVGMLSGPALAVLSLLLILLIAWRSGPKYSLPNTMMFTLLVYFSFAAVVHPWYVALPFALSLFGSWRFMLLWTGLAALSYSHYEGGAFQENYPLIALEYGLLWGMFLLESSRRFLLSRPRNSS